MLKHIQTGRVAEQQFILDATKSGLLVSIPTDDIFGYDFIAQRKINLHKIQVKATNTMESGKDNYRIHIRKSRGKSGKTVKSYLKHEVDFFCCYIAPIGVWLIIPFDETPQSSIRYYPYKENQKLSKYINAFHLIK